MARRSAYYDYLESTQKGSLDITPWLLWFLDTLKEALEYALLRIDRVLVKATFWQRRATTVLNERQIKVLNRLSDTAGEECAQGINARKYQSLAKVSKATATRDLAELVEKGSLSKLPGGGRSSRYSVKVGYGCLLGTIGSKALVRNLRSYLDAAAHRCPALGARWRCCSKSGHVQRWPAYNPRKPHSPC